MLSLLVTPLFLLMHGKDATIPKGQPIIGFVDDDGDVALPVSAPLGGSARVRLCGRVREVIT